MLHGRRRFDLATGPWVFIAIIVGVDRSGEEVERVVAIYSRAKEVLDCFQEKALLLGWDALRGSVSSCSYRGIRELRRLCVKEASRKTRKDTMKRFSKKLRLARRNWNYKGALKVV